MTRERGRLLWSFIISLGFVLLLSEIADSVPPLYGLGIVAAPGMLAAAVFFPVSEHSGWAVVYIVLAIVIDALLYTWPVLIAWRFVEDRVPSWRQAH
jgi:hypothetical protein